MWGEGRAALNALLHLDMTNPVGYVYPYRLQRLDLVLLVLLFFGAWIWDKVTA